MLSDAEIGHVHSTNFKRTRETAEPTAGAFDIKVNLYDPRSLKDLVTQLRQAKGRHLVVGHTNSILKTIELLGGEPGFPIDEKSEFDRLYIVTVGASGTVSTLLMRY
jgi:phosphohistidine phosphatase SixA